MQLPLPWEGHAMRSGCPISLNPQWTSVEQSHPSWLSPTVEIEVPKLNLITEWWGWLQMHMATCHRIVGYNGLLPKRMIHSLTMSNVHCGIPYSIVFLICQFFTWGQDSTRHKMFTQCIFVSYLNDKTEFLVAIYKNIKSETRILKFFWVNRAQGFPSSWIPNVK